MSKAKAKYTNWSEINWRKLEKKLWKLQKRIFRAKKEENVKLVKQLQKLLVKSFAAKTLAVRKITQDNRGKRTAGIDGVKAISPAKRFQLVERLQISHKAKPLRRIYIPKAGTDEKRPLSIPTISDRAYQCLIKYALEPAAEATFNSHSYGFRPSRSCHDIQRQLFNNLNSSSNGLEKRILELDIEKCFDKIDHNFLMQSVQLPKAAKQGVFRAIKAGVRGEFPWSESGTPQGGVISPLLANLVLHGLENVGHEVRLKIRNGGRYIDTINGFRYADDVVFILKPGDDFKLLREHIDNFLEIRGLKVKEAKTKVAHSIVQMVSTSWGLTSQLNPMVNSFQHQVKRLRIALRQKLKQ